MIYTVFIEELAPPPQMYIGGLTRRRISALSKEIEYIAQLRVNCTEQD